MALAPTPGGSLAPHAAGAGDVALYRAEVDRIHNGEGYYQAAATEFTAARGYPTRSVFDWRTPLPMWLLGKLPTAGWGRALLGAMSLALVLMAFEALAREEKYPGGSALAQPPSAVASDLHGRSGCATPPPCFARRFVHFC